MAYKHFFVKDITNIMFVGIDYQGSSNIITPEFINELQNIVNDIKNNAHIKSVIFYSLQPKRDFLLGADVTKFQRNDKTYEEKQDFLYGVTETIKKGQNVFNDIEKLKATTIALITGNCLGGGLELALACDYRIALDNAKLGLPEVKLGLHPGFGGTVRLPKLIGDMPALDMMLTGKTISASAAKKIGLVDDVSPRRTLVKMRDAYLKKSKPKRKTPTQNYIFASKLIRKALVSLYLEKQVSKKAKKEHYPAPFTILDLWANKSNQEGEQTTFPDLLMGRTAQNLIRTFLLGQKSKQSSSELTSNEIITSIHVIGAGVMGGDIAAYAAYKGFNVTLHDRNPKSIAKSIKRAHKLFKKKLKKPHLVEQATNRLTPDVGGDGVREADLVIEAVVENLAVKQEVFKEVEHKAPNHAVLATNTSSIPLEDIRTVLNNPERLIGIHFFNPVAQMMLVEVVHSNMFGNSRNEKGSYEYLQRARQFVTRLGKFPIDVKSSPGFLVNRVLMPYMLEAMEMWEEGKVTKEQIDKAMIDFGMPMGPIQLADVVGLDVCLSVANELSGPLGIDVPQKLKHYVKESRLGRKTGEGFYMNKEVKNIMKTVIDVDTSNEITDRLIGVMSKEAHKCLEEGVVKDADTIDTGMIYGTGFAPFRGGLMKYVES